MVSITKFIKDVVLSIRGLFYVVTLIVKACRGRHWSLIRYLTLDVLYISRMRAEWILGKKHLQASASRSAFTYTFY